MTAFASSRVINRPPLCAASQARSDQVARQTVLRPTTTAELLFHAELLTAELLTAELLWCSTAEVLSPPEELLCRSSTTDSSCGSSTMPASKGCLSHICRSSDGCIFRERAI